MTKRKTAQRRKTTLKRQAKIQLPTQEKDLIKPTRRQELINGHQTSTPGIKTAQLTVPITDTPFKATVKVTATATSTKKERKVVKRARLITHSSTRGQTTTVALRNG